MRYYVVNAFADDLFGGNPAGVCVLDAWPDEALMQSIAMQNNLSETAFVVKKADPPCTYGLRWFTPESEIDLCGHATFGAAYALFRFYEREETEIRFDALLRGHRLSVRRGGGGLLTMDFPSVPPVPFGYEPYMGEALGAVPSEVWKTERDLLLVFDSEDTVASLRPDFEKLKAFPVGLSCYVTARSERPGRDFVCRAFWPKIGIDEDPVCGSMHTTLAPFWAERLGRPDVVSRQVSRRGGTVFCELAGDRVKLSGRGQLYLEGEILPSPEEA